MIDYSVYSFDLSAARTDPERIDVYGTSLTFTRVDSPVNVRLGARDAPPIYIDAPTTLFARDGCDVIDVVYFDHEAGGSGDELEAVTSPDLQLDRGEPHRRLVVVVAGTDTTIVRSASVTVGTSAAALAAGEAAEVQLLADSGNSDNCYVGNADDQEYPLEPGDVVSFPIAELSDVWLKADGAGQTVYVLARS